MAESGGMKVEEWASERGVAEQGCISGLGVSERAGSLSASMRVRGRVE